MGLNFYQYFNRNNMRIIYLLYYIKNLDSKKYFSWVNYIAARYSRSKISLILDSVYCSLVYKTSLLEYFQFGFYNLDAQERKKWAGTGFMYEFQLKMNPKDKRDILDDKTKFHKYYNEFFVHSVYNYDELKNNPALINHLLSQPSGKVVLKVADGKCGAQVKIVNSADVDAGSLLRLMENEKFDLAEEFIIQHPEMNRLSPSAVNTVRIFTQVLDNNSVEILGCRQRISVNSAIDNMAAGNLAAEIDEHTGIIISPGVYSDITKDEETLHPVTGVDIVGFQVPHWPQILEMVKKAALAFPQNKSIGWDIVVTEKGPGLIEGNHDWCKLVWQLPVKRGLKHKLLKHL